MPGAWLLFLWIAIAVALGIGSNKLRRRWAVVPLVLLFGAFVLSLSWLDIVAQADFAAGLMIFFGAAVGLSILGLIVVIGPYLAGRYLVRAVFAVSGGRYGGGFMRARS